MKIAIVDYGSGNLRSVSKAIEKIAPISTQVLVTGDPEEVLKADRVVFPGPVSYTHLTLPTIA